MFAVPTPLTPVRNMINKVRTHLNDTWRSIVHLTWGEESPNNTSNGDIDVDAQDGLEFGLNTSLETSKDKTSKQPKYTCDCLNINSTYLIS
jgi:hypothetical protein